MQHIINERPKYKTIIVLIFCLLFTKCTICLSAAAIPMPPGTTDNIHLGQVFTYSIPDPKTEVGIIDYVWGSGSLPSGVYNTHYEPFSREPDNDNLPLGVSSNHNLAWFKANHPDWIEYKQDRKTVAYIYNDPLCVPLDIANPDVRTYLLNTYYIPAINAGYSGIAFDNVNLANFAWDTSMGQRRGHYDASGNWVQQYTGSANDPAYHADVISWAQWMYTQLHAHSGSVSMNIEWDYPASPTDMNRLVNYMDIYVDEGGFGNIDGYPTGSEWVTKIQFFQSVVNKGKGLFIINEMTQNFAILSRANKQWLIANYLLVKGNNTYMTISGNQEYGSLLTTSEYFARIGSATNTMYQSQGVYMRDFTNGKAIVNPSSTQSFTVNLPANTYKDLYGNSKSSITLGAASGIVLLNETITVNQLVQILVHIVTPVIVAIESTLASLSSCIIWPRDYRLWCKNFCLVL